MKASGLFHVLLPLLVTSFVDNASAKIYRAPYYKPRMAFNALVPRDTPTPIPAPYNPPEQQPQPPQPTQLQQPPQPQQPQQPSQPQQEQPQQQSGPGPNYSFGFTPSASKQDTSKEQLNHGSSDMSPTSPPDTSGGSNGDTSGASSGGTSSGSSGTNSYSSPGSANTPATVSPVARSPSRRDYAFGDFRPALKVRQKRDVLAPPYLAHRNENLHHSHAKAGHHELVKKSPGQIGTIYAARGQYFEKDSDNSVDYMIDMPNFLLDGGNPSTDFRKRKAPEAMAPPEYKRAYDTTSEDYLYTPTPTPSSSSSTPMFVYAPASSTTTPSPLPPSSPTPTPAWTPTVQYTGAAMRVSVPDWLRLGDWGSTGVALLAVGVATAAFML